MKHNARAAEGSRLFVAERALRDDPDEVGRRLDVFGERALIVIACPVHESCDVVADFWSGDGTANFHDVAREVTAGDGPGLAVVVDVYPPWVSR